MNCHVGRNLGDTDSFIETHPDGVDYGLFYFGHVILRARLLPSCDKNGCAASNNRAGFLYAFLHSAADFEISRLRFALFLALRHDRILLGGILTYVRNVGTHAGGGILRLSLYSGGIVFIGSLRARDLPLRIEFFIQ